MNALLLALPLGLPVASMRIGRSSRSAGVPGDLPPTKVSDSGGTT